MVKIKAEYAGLDMGASKTKIRIETKDSHLITQYYENGSNYLLAGKKAYLAELFKIIEKIVSNYHVNFIGIGAAGLGNDADIDFVRNELIRHFPTLNFNIVSDAEILLNADSEHPSKVVVVIGTGSIIMGRTTYNEVVRLGGWGHHFDEVSGAYSVGKKLIQNAIKYIEQESEDKRGYLLLKHHWQNELPETQIRKIYHSEHPVSEIAGLAKIITEQLENNDSEIEMLLKECIVYPIFHQLEFFRTLHHFPKPCPLFFSGGLIEKNKYLQQYFALQLENSDFYEIKSFYLDPCLGAISMCK